MLLGIASVSYAMKCMKGAVDPQLTLWTWGNVLGEPVSCDIMLKSGKASKGHAISTASQVSCSKACTGVSPAERVQVKLKTKAFVSTLAAFLKFA